jgi:tetratricopeptide (TPR) repeat protein
MNKPPELNPQLDYDWAESCLEQGRSQDAIVSFTRYLTRRPEHTRAYLLRGCAADRLGKFEQALADFSEVIRREPQGPLAYHLRGIVHGRQKAFDKALEDFTLALRLDPADVHGRNEGPACVKGRGLIRQPELQSARFCRAEAYLALEQNEPALADFTEYLQHETTNPMAYLSRGKLYAMKNEYGAALADLSAAVRLAPDLTDALMTRAGVRVALNDLPGALNDVEEVLRQDPHDDEALLTRGNLRATLGQLEEALPDFTAYLQLFPQSALALRSRALAFTRLQRYDEALTDLHKAAQIDPKNADIFHDRGRTYQEKGHYTAAVADYEKSLQLRPDDPHLYNQYAWMLAACPQAGFRDGPRAVELALRGCELSNWQNGNILDTLGSAYAECGRFDEALEWAQKALPLVSPEVQETVREHVQLFRDHRPARFLPLKSPQPGPPPQAPKSKTVDIPWWKRKKRR